MAVTHWGFFSDPQVPYSKDPSVWDYLFGDQPVLGLVRLAVFATGAFLIGSLAALLVAGRWISAGGGLKTDAAQKAATAATTIDEQQRIIESFKAELGHVKAQRDSALAVVQEVVETTERGVKHDGGQ
jgi:hypothetical protein